MKNLIFILALMLFTVLKANASTSVALNEDVLYKLLKESPPTLQNLEASFLSSDVSRAKALDIFSPTLSASANALDSDEKSLNSFIPVTSKYKALTLSVNKPLQYGAALGGKVFTEKSTNTQLTNATTTGYGVSLSVDLYKDLFGRSSRANLELTESASRRARAERDIQAATFKNNIRKIYWALVANEEALKITKTLLSSSEKQLKDANRRYKSGIADKGELARYNSQISSRKASLISIRWEKSKLQQQLKLLLPKLSESELELAPYNIDKTVQDVLACSALISKYKEAPMDFTKYDEVVEYLNQEEASQRKLVKNYDSIDLKLVGEYESTGKAFSQSDSLDDLSDDGRGSLSVGLQFTMPLGSTKKDTREIQDEITSKMYGAQKREAAGKVNAYHFQTIKSVALLNEIVFNQKENTKYLSQSLKVSKRKYSQARISAQQLVQEQDAYLQSNLDEISTKLAVIGLLMDYFTVFSETPCELNRNL
ncbi:MAG: outer membrane protein TolC [Bacteriovoracaceae bacterium]|jgi:outer membrane protein TolC